MQKWNCTGASGVDGISYGVIDIQTGSSFRLELSEMKEPGDTRLFRFWEMRNIG